MGLILALLLLLMAPALASSASFVCRPADSSWNMVCDPVASPPPAPLPAPMPPAPPAPTPPPTPVPMPPDNSPFIFPAQPYISPLTDGSTRYLGLGSDPATGWPCYAGLQVMPNPAPASYLYAGNRPNNLSDGTAGMRVWVPSGAQPAAIRLLLQGGKLPAGGF